MLILTRSSADDDLAIVGGLSIRRVSAIRRLLAFQRRENDTQGEDNWFGKRISSMPGLRLASAQQEAQFSVQEVFRPRPMGYHVRSGDEGLADDVWQNWEQRKAIMQYCPEVKIIMPMKLERERCEGDTRDGYIDPNQKEKAAKELEEAQKAKEKIHQMEIAKFMGKTGPEKVDQDGQVKQDAEKEHEGVAPEAEKQKGETEKQNAEEPKPEEQKGEQKTEEPKPEQKGEQKTEEQKAEQKPEEQKGEQKSEEHKEVPKPEEHKEAPKPEEQKEEQKTDDAGGNAQILTHKAE